jgi:hypothetical protein
MNEELKSIFGDAVTVGEVSAPVAHLRYKGKATTYVTWTITGEKPALSADNSPLYGVVAVDVDVFSKGNYLALAAEIKRLMLEHDWVWVGDSPEMYEEDTETYHKTISFEKERNL